MQHRKNMKGFTLVELLMALGVFSLISASITATFVAGFSSYRETKELQRNLESAQFVMNTIAKQLRTGSIVSDNKTEGGLGHYYLSSYVRFYDYSSGRCHEYRIGGGVVEGRWKTVAIPSGERANAVCTTSGMPSWTVMTTGYVEGSFWSDQSKKYLDGYGVVTIFPGYLKMHLIIKAGATSDDSIRIQTMVRPRDYSDIETMPATLR